MLHLPAATPALGPADLLTLEHVPQGSLFCEPPKALCKLHLHQCVPQSYGRRFIIMAGDPCQLPPVVASPASVTLHPSSSAAAVCGPAQGAAMQGSSGPAAQSPSRGPSLQGLARPLLVRLVQMGHRAHLLRTQYRQDFSLHLLP